MALEKRYVAKLDTEVTRLGVGALPMGPLQRQLSPADGGRVIRAALERGVNFVDTATAYRTYEHVAAGIRGWDGPLVVSTKTHARTDADAAREHIETALKSLDRDYIDIMLCHCARSPFTDDEWGPTFEALLAARDKGVIRMVGISSHTVGAVRAAAQCPEVDAIHPLFNQTGMGIIDGGAEDMFIYAMKAMAGGNLVPTREQALRYVLAIQQVDSVIVGMVTEREVEWNVRYFGGEEIPEDLAEETSMHSKRLNILEFICEGCGACVEHCENDALFLEGGVAKVRRDQCILCGYCAPHCPQFAIRMV